jgi:hypothetical protein
MLEENFTSHIREIFSKNRINGSFTWEKKKDIGIFLGNSSRGSLILNIFLNPELEDYNKIKELPKH